MSAKLLLPFLIKLVLLTFIVGLLFYWMEARMPAQYFYHNYMGLLLFFFTVTLLLHLGYEKSFAKGSKYFVRFYMLTSGLKLFSFLTIIVAYAFIDKEHITAFALNFLILYFIYTAFELIISYKKFGTEVISKS